MRALTIRYVVAAALALASAGPAGAAHSAPPRGPSDANRVGAVLQGVAGSLGDGFAGAWLDTDGRVRVGFAGAHGVATARANARLAPLVHDPAVVLVARTYSQRQLHAALRRATAGLSAVFATTPGHVVPSSFLGMVNLPGNEVDVTVASRYADRLAAVDARLAHDIARGIVRVRLGSVAGSDLSCTRSSCSPLRGGIEIESSAGYCSSAFVVRTNSGALNRRGVKHLLSAGHCGTATWYNGGTRFGSTEWLRNGGNVDAEIVTLDNPDLPQAVNQVYKAADSATPVTTKVTDPSTTVVNTPLCLEGRTSGESCGTLLSNDESNSTDGIAHDGFGYTDVPACEGDSGGAVIDDGNKAYGIVSGGYGSTVDTTVTRKYVDSLFDTVKPPECFKYMSFSWTANLEAASGFSLMLNGSSETLGSNQTLKGGQMAQSTDGRYTAEMQNDGNFVVYKPGHIAVWATNTAGNPGAWVTMQSDGNMVVYRSNRTVAYTSNTSGHPDSTLIIQPDCNLVLYSVSNTALWSSGTQFC